MKNVTRQVLILKNFSSPAESVIDAYLEKRRRKDSAADKGGAILTGVIAFGMFVTGLAVYGAVCLARLVF